MKRWFSLLLFAAVLLGLLGQEAVFAGGLPMAKAEQVSAETAQMNPECAAAMGLPKPAQQSEQPCQGITPDCVAKMGCAVSVALLPPFAVGPSLQFRAALPTQMAVAPLVGRETGPEPEPPSLLG